jgi:hypothetical protein
MFIDDDFWNLFSSTGDPKGSLLWAAAPVLLVVVLPALILLAGIIIEWVRLGPTKR